MEQFFLSKTQIIGRLFIVEKSIKNEFQIFDIAFYRQTW